MDKVSFIQIPCRPANDVQVGAKTIRGLLISAADAAFLRTLDGSGYIVSLECPGRRTLHARVQSLLARMVQAPFSDDWYVSVTGTGPLYVNDK